MSFIKRIKKEKKSASEPKNTKIASSAIKPASSWRVLKRPYLSEKAGFLGALNKYVFLIDAEANKSEVKKAVEMRYGVNVVFVNILNKKGKIKRFGNRFGRLPKVKKAVVTLKVGQKMEGGN